MLIFLVLIAVVVCILQLYLTICLAFEIDLPNPFEHLIEFDAKQIFPNETLKHEMISKSGPSEFTMPYLKYNVLGFNISATDIEVKPNAKQVSDDSDLNKKTRIDFPVMLARNVNISNKVTSQSYHNVDLSSVYAIYDPKTDKSTFHVPFNIAAILGIKIHQTSKTEFQKKSNKLKYL